MGLIPGLGRFLWSRTWQPTSVCFPGESHGQRNLVDYSPWGCQETDTTEQLSLLTVSKYPISQPLWRKKREKKKKIIKNVKN